MFQFCSGQHHRLQNFIDSAFILAEKTQEKIELLIVEWNPPKNNRRVIDAFVRMYKYGYTGKLINPIYIYIYMYIYRDSEVQNF